MVCLPSLRLFINTKTRPFTHTVAMDQLLELVMIFTFQLMLTHQCTHTQTSAVLTNPPLVTVIKLLIRGPYWLAAITSKHPMLRFILSVKNTYNKHSLISLYHIFTVIFQYRASFNISPYRILFQS